MQSKNKKTLPSRRDFCFLECFEKCAFATSDIETRHASLGAIQRHMRRIRTLTKKGLAMGTLCFVLRKEPRKAQLVRAISNMGFAVVELQGMILRGLWFGTKTPIIFVSRETLLSTPWLSDAPTICVIESPEEKAVIQQIKKAMSPTITKERDVASLSVRTYRLAANLLALEINLQKRPGHRKSSSWRFQAERIRYKLERLQETL